MSVPTPYAAAPSAVPSAGGAPLDQILVMLAFTSLVYAAVGWVVLRETTGHSTLVGRLATTVGRLDGSPRWFALPQAITLAGIVSGVVGLYWDVSYHLAFGRDEGPLANPAHYFIYLGLVAIFAGAVLGAALADEGLPRNTLRITRTWRSPFGPVVAMAVGMIALLGFPLDDFWHRLFGQDVTEWGPTHVLMIGGTVLSAYAILLACREVAQVSSSRVRPFFEFVALVIVPCGPVAFLLEFAYGIPQFPLVNDALILSLTASLAFVLAALRHWWLPLAVWAAYAAVQLGLLGLNVFVWDALAPWPPLLLGGALAGAVVGRFARPTWRFGVASGVVVMLAQVGVEYLWTAAVRPMPWPTDLLPYALAGGVVVGAAGGLLAVWLHVTLRRVGARGPVPEPAGPAVGGRPAGLALAAVLATLAVTVPPTAAGAGEVVADLAILDRTGGARAEGVVEVRLDPADAAEDSWWFETLSWQGGGAEVGTLEEVGPGVYRTTEPVPLHGSWKTLVRLHRPVTEILALPVYLPADEAIPVAETPAVDARREFVAEKLVLRREEKQDVPGWLWGTAYAVVGVLVLALLGVLAAGLTAAARTRPQPERSRRATVGADASITPRSRSLRSPNR